MSSPLQQRPLRVAILNDYEVVVRGLQSMLEPFADQVEVVELDANLPVATPVDVTLYDTFSQAQVDATEIDEILDDEKTGQVVVYTWNMDPRLVEIALSKGCRGYLTKELDGESLVSAIERVGAGQVMVSPVQPTEATTTEPRTTEPRSDDWPGRQEGLSAREAEVVSLITQGLTNQDIAERTYLSINSVKTYIRTAYRKMGVSRRSQAVRWGLEHGMSPQVMRDTTP